MDNLNKALETATTKYTTNELISLFTNATIPISKVNTISEVIEDPYVKGRSFHQQTKDRYNDLPCPAACDDKLCEIA